jgi:hypothetical protein
VLSTLDAKLDALAVENVKQRTADEAYERAVQTALKEVMDSKRSANKKGLEAGQGDAMDVDDENSNPAKAKTRKYVVTFLPPRSCNSYFSL